MNKRDEIIAEALTWLGTPYQHAQMVKGAGVDCGMILVGIFSAVGLIPPEFRPKPYAPDWHMHRSEEKYLDQIKGFAHEIERNQAQRGDVVVFKFGRTFSHGAVIIDASLVLHAALKDGKVTLADMSLDADLIERDLKFFRVMGLV